MMQIMARRKWVRRFCRSACSRVTSNIIPTLLDYAAVAEGDGLALPHDKRTGKFALVHGRELTRLPRAQLHPGRHVARNTSFVEPIVTSLLASWIIVRSAI
jgi:hypothetical protein